MESELGQRWVLHYAYSEVSKKNLENEGEKLTLDILLTEINKRVILSCSSSPVLVQATAPVTSSSFNHFSHPSAVRMMDFSRRSAHITLLKLSNSSPYL